MATRPETLYGDHSRRRCSVWARQSGVFDDRILPEAAVYGLHTRGGMPVTCASQLVKRIGRYTDRRKAYHRSAVMVHNYWTHAQPDWPTLVCANTRTSPFADVYSVMTWGATMAHLLREWRRSEHWPLSCVTGDMPIPRSAFPSVLVAISALDPKPLTIALRRSATLPIPPKAGLGLGIWYGYCGISIDTNSHYT